MRPLLTDAMLTSHALERKNVAAEEVGEESVLERIIKDVDSHSPICLLCLEVNNTFTVDSMDVLLWSCNYSFPWATTSKMDIRNCPQSTPFMYPVICMYIHKDHFYLLTHEFFVVLPRTLTWRH